MPRYRVTLRYSAVEVVEAANPYMAALVVHDLHGDGVEVADVRPAVGRTAATTTVRKATKTATATKKVAKKRKPMSAENRAKLAQNLVKARAARAAKAKGTKRATKKKAAKKS
jgi:hypothetical protein